MYYASIPGKQKVKHTSFRELYVCKNFSFFFKICRKNKIKVSKKKSSITLCSFKSSNNYKNLNSCFLELQYFTSFSKRELIRMTECQKNRQKHILVSHSEYTFLTNGTKINIFNTCFSLVTFFHSFYNLIPSFFSKFQITGERRVVKLNITSHGDIFKESNSNLLRFFYMCRPVNHNYKPELNYSLLNHYMGDLLFGYTGFSTDWFFFNIEPSTMLTKYLVIINRVYRSRQQRFLKIKKPLYFRLIVQLSLLKNPRLLILVLEHLFIKTPIKRHRSIFFKLRHFLKIWYLICRKKRCVKGFSFFFKGKLGRKGSVRKRKFFTKKGLISFTNKELRVNYSNYILWTNTGCIGANISIFF